MFLSKNEYKLLIQNEEQVLSTKNKILFFDDSNRKKILLFCCLIFVLVSLCLISFYYFQFEHFWKKKHFWNYNNNFQHKGDEIYKLIGDYEYCDRINGPYINCLNGGVCVKIDCYILDLKNWNNCIQCICLKVSYLILN